MTLTLKEAIKEFSIITAQLNESDDLEKNLTININKDNKNIKFEPNNISINTSQIKINNPDLSKLIEYIEGEKQINISYNNSSIISFSNNLITITTNENNTILMQPDKIIINTNEFNSTSSNNTNITTPKINFNKIPYITDKIEQQLIPIYPGVLTIFVSNNTLPIPPGWSICNINLFLLKSRYCRPEHIVGYDLFKNHFNSSNRSLSYYIDLLTQTTTINYNNVNYNVPLVMDVSNNNGDLETSLFANKINAYWEPKNVLEIYPWKRIKELNSNITDSILLNLILECYVFQPDMKGIWSITGRATTNVQQFNTEYSVDHSGRGQEGSMRSFLKAQYIMKY